MKKIYIFLIAISFVGSFLGCSLISGKEDAETVAESFMEDRIAHGGFAGHDTYYGDIFWQHAKEEDWQRVQQMVDIALGDLNSYSLLTSNTQSKFHTNELSGTFVTLVYNTEYEKGNGLETLTMYKGLKDNDFRIIGQHVNSPKIQELIYKGIEQVSGQ
jgi:hypothetical protein